MKRSMTARRGLATSVGTAHYWPLPAALVSLFVVVGCSGAGGLPRGESVSGSVTWQGKPLALGTIRFVPTAGEDQAGNKATITNGRYELPNPPGLTPGSYTVRINARGTSKKNAPVSELPKDVPDFNPVDPLSQEQIPQKYNDQSTLTAEVARGPNTKDFDLTGTRGATKGKASSPKPSGGSRGPL